MDLNDERLTPKEEADFILLVMADVVTGELTQEEADEIIDHEFELQAARK